MVIHIFRKDLRLLWPFIAGAALVQLGHLAIALRLGVAPEMNSVGLYYYWGYACALAAQLLIVLAVQQDSLVGTQQDWLVRPVARRDMLLAKLLFVVVAVQGPIFLFDLVLGLLHGAPLPAAVMAALFSGVQVVVTIDLIAFIAAAVTENLQQAVIFLLAVLIVKISGSQLWRLFSGMRYPAMQLEIAWMAALLAGLIMLTAAFGILPLQYFRRRTFAARLLLSVTIVLLLASNFLPWNTAFALSELLLPGRSSTGAISFGYNPGLGRLRSNVRYGIDRPQFSVPVHIANLPPHSLLTIGSFKLSVSDKSGQVVYQAGTTDIMGSLGGVIPGGAGANPLGPIEAQNPTDRPISVDFYHTFQLPRQQFLLLKSRQLRLHLVYSLVLLHRNEGEQTIAAIGGDKYLPGYGQCASRTIDQFGYPTFGVWCFAEADAPHCVAISIENQAGKRNPEDFWCFPDFTPRWWKLSAPLEPAREVAPYFFWDMRPNRPVKTVNAGQSRFLLTAYEPQAYFTREFDSPEVRLADLTEQFDPNFDPKLGQEYSTSPVQAVRPRPRSDVSALPSAPIACTLHQPAAPSPMGHGTAIGFQDPAAARAEIPLRQAQQGGAIDPQYIDDQRVLVRQSGGRMRPFDLAAGVSVHLGDHVALQNSYRSKALTCAYVPVMITADLGPASVPQPVPQK
jgi:hypothetical protein